MTTPDAVKAYAKALFDALVAEGFTQSEFARRIGVTRSQVADMLCARMMPPPELRATIKQALRGHQLPD